MENLKHLLTVCAEAYPKEKEETKHFIRFAFAKLAYNIGFTYKDISDELGMANHTGAVYCIKRSDNLLNEELDIHRNQRQTEQALTFRTYWADITPALLKSYRHESYDPAKEISEKICDLIDSQQNIDKVYRCLVANGVPTYSERCCNDVTTMLELNMKHINPTR